MSRVRPRWRRPPSDLVIERRQLFFALGLWGLSLLAALGLGFGLGRMTGGTELATGAEIAPKAAPAVPAPEVEPADPASAPEAEPPADPVPAPEPPDPAPEAAPAPEPPDSAPDAGPAEATEASPPGVAADAGPSEASAPDAGPSEAPPEAEPPDPPVKPADPPNSGFGVQLGSFPSRAEAEAFLSRNAAALSAQPNYIQAVRVRGKGQWFRVRHGRWEASRAASAQLKRLPKALAKGAILIEYR